MPRKDQRPGGNDQITFDRTTFANFDPVLAASTPVGSDTVISVDAEHSVTPHQRERQQPAPR